jgi:hypothetical protein
MSRIGSEYILVVSRETVKANFTVSVEADVRAALKNWGAATRSSPIFALDSAVPPSLTGRRETQLCFLGPMRPEELPPGVRAFLSFGIYNVVLFASTADEKQALKRLFAHRTHAPWELWTLAGNTLISVDVSPQLQKRFPAVKVRQLSLPVRLRSATDEYQTLIAVAKARTHAYLPEVADELAAFEDVFEKQLRTLNVHSIRKLQWLINVNAALSRFSSQTFAGTSPILGTECHFWTHSLLGIGVASKALLNVRQQVEKAAAEAAFLDRIDGLRLAPPTPDKLSNIKAADPWWTTAELPAASPRQERANSARLPLVVYYSGRDGFKSTTFTLSAPLEVLYGANTYAWSLQTITHELSHVLVERIISGVLDGDIDSTEWQTKMEAINSGRAKPSNLFERVQELFIEACSRLEWESRQLSDGAELNVDARQVVARHYQDTSELLAHLFDYIYFYNQDKEAYLRSIWSSWDVIPSIESRIPNYITRSLFALQFSNLSVKDSNDVCISQLREQLEALRTKIKDQQYIEFAIATLDRDEQHFRESLDNRLFLAKFAKVAMYSADAVRAFLTKPPSSSREHKRAAGLRSGVFEANRPVQNPLAFIAETAKHEDPSMAKSLWALTQLAFVEDSATRNA